MGWADKYIRNLRQGRLVEFTLPLGINPFRLSFYQEKAKFQPCKHANLTIGDIVLVQFKAGVAVSSIRSIRQGKFQFQIKTETVWIESNLIYGVLINKPPAMFSLEELKTKANQISLGDLPEPQVQEFDLSIEESIEFFRAFKSEYSSSIHFLLKCLDYLGKGDFYYPLVTGVECEAISHQTLINEISQRSHQLGKSHDFSLHGEFQRAMALIYGWSEFLLLSETDKEYLVFSWHTSA
jgi:hypothetical protein